VAHWIVVLEVVVEGDDPQAKVRRLEESLADLNVTTLYSRDRYAAHLRITATTCVEALLTAFSRWQEAAQSLELPSSQVVRAEVLTVEEFEQETRNHDAWQRLQRSDGEPPTPAT
jgi:acetyl/propionyl-CoA carboxylase alpha subunit